VSLARVGDFFRRLSGWRALLASILAGAVYALGFAPLDVFPAMLLGLAAFVLLLDGASARPRPLRHAAWIGWGFGFGQFAAGMHWIFYPFLVDPLEHAWQIPFVLVLFPGGLALFTTLAAAVAMRFWRFSRVFVFAACYAGAEWLRGHVLTGFPWNLPGYGWGASLAILQSTALLGVYGLSLLTVLFGASLAELFGARPRWTLPVAMTALFATLWLGGVIRLESQPTAFTSVHLRLVQPNVPQDEKYVRALAPRNWQTLMSLSSRAGGVHAIQPDVVIWPEAAPPVLLQRSPDALADIAVLTGKSRVLITGNQRLVVDANGKRHFFNSLYVFGPGGRVAATYDKFHLVPFGEYLPLEDVLERIGITKLVGFPGSFSAGDGPHTVDVPGAPPAGPLICYEILFPAAVVGATRPAWFVNVTDDSWFGPWAGPRQHLLAARVRAIEEGLPLARAANTGISAVVDGKGRIVAQRGLDETGVVDALLPRAEPATPYATTGDLLFFVLLILFAALPQALLRR
jgi:apolipoprotein N-acyltransferase